ncbi:MAG: LysM peptidoglycan-binding domain-containing M23 family metallopeptidase [Cyanobacteria bacterium P01_H01_bin.15]
MLLNFLIAGLSIVGSLETSTLLTQAESSPSVSLCQPPILSRLERYRLQSGETIESVASRFGLVPLTLYSLNPQLGSPPYPAGTTILRSPINGIAVNPPPGATWKDLEGAYGVRADVLFEINGCEPSPTRVFIPGITWESAKQVLPEDYESLRFRPLASASVGLGYGWQSSGSGGSRFFHSGTDLLAEMGTAVVAADSGTVVYAGPDETYGNLVVISHGPNRQTRYAHLSRLQVIPSQTILAGQTIGAVGQTGQPDLPQPHLHFEVRYRTPVGWIAQDPNLHLPQEQ